LGKISVVYRRRALSDLQAIFAHVARDDPGAAQKLALKIVSSIEMLGQFSAESTSKKLSANL